MKRAHFQHFTLWAVLSGTTLGCIEPLPYTSTSSSSSGGEPDSGLSCTLKPEGADGGEAAPLCMPNQAMVEGTLDGQPISEMWTGIWVSYSVEPWLVPPFSMHMQFTPWDEIDAMSDVAVEMGQYNPLTKGTFSRVSEKSPRQILSGSACRIDCRARHIECLLNVEGGHIGACAWEK